MISDGQVSLKSLCSCMIYASHRTSIHKISADQLT